MNKLSKLTKYQQTNRIPIISKTSTVSRGFTIIELLIVIVIIAILVAITAVGFNGITKSAKEASAKSDLKQAATQLEADKAKSSNNQYPNNTNNLKTSPNNNLEITSNGTSYCLSVTSTNDIAFNITNTNTNPQPGVCSGHLAADAPSEIANNTPIQDMNRKQCSNLPIYTGTNDSALRTVTDNRDGTTRSYRIAKLADNKCWMLDNLKLGKTTGTTTLTPANTNIATNFTLPQVQTTGSYNNDIPEAIGPIPGDTGNGATNYGYLYNWPAATAGETRTTMPAGSGNAQYSICPKNWKLPAAGWNADWSNTIGDFPDLDRAFGGTGEYAGSGQSNIAKWQNTGPFKGVFSGSWYGSFYDQGSGGGWWSSSANPVYSSSAFYAFVSPDGVGPGDYYLDRYGGFGVRCLLN